MPLAGPTAEAALLESFSVTGITTVLPVLSRTFAGTANRVAVPGSLAVGAGFLLRLGRFLLARSGGGNDVRDAEAEDAGKDDGAQDFLDGGHGCISFIGWW